MPLTDPIADFLTRIRNAQKARHGSVEIPASRIKERIARLLQKEGFVSKVELLPGKPQNVLRMGIRYEPDGSPMIREIRRVSRPGCRVYASAGELGSETRGISVAIVSTPRGVLTDREAFEANVGGEVLCRVS